ncbi:hypothetical protein [Aquimonas voraii]|uniref:Uncharacterized protein n=1 Tax=Aquimonas voraii TaxID=265719 RepID=A0A1G7AHT5_9GAMM|nr:hypothetical protein [Aquimonas voraii]SDE14498.1 hypothetical protein SAMN04488509_1283 [Aquimonas voraii]
MLLAVIAALAVYLAIGAASCFLGPAARWLRRALRQFVRDESPSVYWLEESVDEGGSQTSDKNSAPLPWRKWFFTALLTAIILIAWPLLLVATFRSENAHSSGKADWEPPTEPSRRAAAYIARAAEEPTKRMSIEEFRSIGDGLSASDAYHIREAMEKQGHQVLLATMGDGQLIPVTFAVARNLGQLITLTPDGEGGWEFETSPESWDNLGGCSGRAHIEDGVVVSVFITNMN